MLDGSMFHIVKTENVLISIMANTDVHLLSKQIAFVVNKHLKEHFLGKQRLIFWTLSKILIFI
jgi:hypothetical protein